MLLFVEVDRAVPPCGSRRRDQGLHVRPKRFDESRRRELTIDSGGRLPVRSFHDDAPKNRQRRLDIEPASDRGRPSSQPVRVVLALEPVPVWTLFLAGVQATLPTSRTSQQLLRHCT